MTNALALLMPSAVGNLDAYIQAANSFSDADRGRGRRSPAVSVMNRIWTPPASWCSRTCGWLFRSPVATSATACRTPT